MKVIYGDIGFPLALSSGSVEYGLRPEDDKPSRSGFRQERGEVTSANIQRGVVQAHLVYSPKLDELA